MNNIEGKIIKINKNIYTVRTANGVFECIVRGKLRNDRMLVGDSVNIDVENKTIEQLNERKNSLIRPLVSNIDKLFIVTSTTIPNFSTFLLDKFLVLSKINNIKPIIIITKLDKVSRKEKSNIIKILKYYKSIGYTVLKNTQINKIKKEIKNNIVSLAGQTGTGKSTLLNKIDKNLKLNTGEVSIALGRGKHTTRLVELFEVSGGLIADTPGFSSLELNITSDELMNGFIEFGYNCKYNSCHHQNEEGCDVIKRVKCGKILLSRYENYLSMLGSVKK